jgi:FlgD Ig-like domain
VNLRYTVPVLGVCLVAGIVTGCICHWTPPDTHAEPADTTALGLNVVYPVMTLWPGETRRIRLPDVEHVTMPCALVVRGSPVLSVSTEPGRARSSTYRTSVMPMPTPATNFVGPLLPVVIPNATPPPPRECWIHADSLGMSGDSTALRVTLTTMTKPERHSRWTWPVRIAHPQTASVSPFALSGESRRDAHVIKHPPKETSVSAYPNPFNPQTMVEFAVTIRCDVTVRIHDASGACIRALLCGERDIGSYNVLWDGRTDDGGAVASGIYFVRVQAGPRTVTCKLVLLK